MSRPFSETDPQIVERCRKAIQYLGTRWVLHAQYSPERHPNHSLSHRHSAILAQHCAKMRQQRGEA